MLKLSVVVAAGLLLCGVSGYAIAQSASAPPKRIKACAQKKGGALRVAKKCRKGERRVTWGATGPGGQPGAPGQDGGPGAPGAGGTNGTNGTSGTSTGETFFASAGFGANFGGGGGACDTTVAGGPSVTVNVPSGSYVQVMASVTMQRAGGTSNAACIHIDTTDVQFAASSSLGAETRYVQRGTGAGTTDPFAAQPLTFPLSAGAHTISLRYGAAGGTSNFTNRNLYVTVFHPTQ